MPEKTHQPTKPAAEGNLIDGEELAARLHLTQRQLAELRRKRVIPHVRLSRKKFRYSWSRVVEALARLEVKAVGEKAAAPSCCRSPRR